MTTPHLPPNHNPNIAPAPHNAEPLPENNSVMSPEDWNAAQVEVATSLQELQQTFRQQANLDRFEQQGQFNQLGGAAQKAQLQQEIHDTRKRAMQNISRLAAETDTESVIGILTQSAAGSAHVEQSVDKRVQKADEAVTKSAHARNAQLTQYYDVIRTQNANPASGDAKKKQKKVAAGSEHSAVIAIIAAQKAEQEQATELRMQAEYGDYSALVHSTATLVRQEQHQRIQEAEQYERLANAELAAWDISGSEAFSGQADQARDSLLKFKEKLDDMGNHNSEAARLKGVYNRLRYRVEQRERNRGALNVMYREDKGILLADLDTVVYEDGSSARRENGGFVRRNPNGTEWQPLREEQRVPLGSVQAPQTKTYGETFKDWEASRTPQASAELYASLEDYLKPRQEHEAQLVALVKDIRQQINTSTDPVVVARLKRDEQLRINHLRTMRSEINPALYWKGFLEVNGDVEHEVQQQQTRNRFLGRLAGRRTVQPAAQPREYPSVTQEGLVRWNTEINGVTTQWNIAPDGSARRHDPADPNYIFIHAPNGQRVTRVRS